jgi:hypothetical protein
MARAWKFILRPLHRREKKLVPEEGVEPTRPCDQRILSPPRLPFRHSGVRIS